MKKYLLLLLSVGFLMSCTTNDMEDARPLNLNEENTVETKAFPAIKIKQCHSTQFYPLSTESQFNSTTNYYFTPVNYEAYINDPAFRCITWTVNGLYVPNYDGFRVLSTKLQPGTNVIKVVIEGDVPYLYTGMATAQRTIEVSRWM